MGDVVEMPKAAESKRDELYKALTTLVNITTLLLFVTVIPVNIWLWTVTL